MFTFLNTIILTALFAALIPLLIHLFNKQKTKKIKFSSLRFLKKLEKQRLKKVKIFQVLLIIIRTLLIILLVFAFARPTFSSAWSLLQKPSANTTAVIILDDGLHMMKYDASGKRFNRALIKLNQLLKSFKPEDRMFITKTSGKDILITDTLDIHLEECSYLPGDLNSGLLKANRYFQENQNLNKELHIISDMSVLTEQVILYAQQNHDKNIYLENINQEEIGNISIEKIEFENKLFEINKPIHIKIYLKNHFSVQEMNVITHLFINEKRMVQNSSGISSGEQKIIPLTFIPKTAGWNVGYVEINDDDLIEDNKLYFSIKIPEKLKVLFVDNKPSPYLSSALETINNSTNIELITEKYNSIAQQSFTEFDVLCLSNLPELSNTLISRIKSFIAKGGGIILIPGNKTIPSNFNTSWSSVFAGLHFLDLTSAKNMGGYFTLRNIDENNPVIQDLFRKESPDISLPTFVQYFRMTNTDQFQKLIQFNDGSPFLLYSEQKHLNAFIMASYIDDAWTNLQFKGLFIPMLIKMMKYSASKFDMNKNQVFVGKESIVSIEQSTDKRLYELESPTGQKNRISPMFSDGELLFNFSEFSIPGNYKIQQGSEIYSVISANVDVSKLGRPSININQLEAEYDNVTLINEEDNINDKLQQARFGEEIWKYIIALALFVLFLESFVVKRIEGKI